MSKSRHLILSLSIVFAFAFLPGMCRASHPYHVSNAEVNWNPSSGNFEVALCVWPTDLEKALANDQSKIIDLDKVENLDALIKQYVEKRFIVRDSESSTNQPTKIRWVGHERDLKTAWLYFEVEGGKQPAKYTIENRVFFEMNEDQMNQLQLKVGKTVNSVICRSGESRFSLETVND